jgi:dipeptidase
VAKKLDGWAAISNVYSIGSDYDRISDGAIAYATAAGWFNPAAGVSFDFAAAYGDPAVEFLPSCNARLACAESRLATLERRGRIALEDVFSLLRSHGAGDQQHDWRPGADGESLICMHAVSPESSETAASMVAELSGPQRPDEPYRLWLSLASPCLSSFVPVWPDSDAPEGWQQPSSNEPDAWWRWELMQRLVEQDYGRLSAAPRSMLAELEAETLAAVRALENSQDGSGRRALTRGIAQRQDAAGRIIADLTRASAAEVIVPRLPDPRGDYLGRVDAARIATSRGSVSTA